MLGAARRLRDFQSMTVVWRLLKPRPDGVDFLVVSLDAS